ncbi:O-antigen ligase family protein [Globicatella sanguinis]|uniref:O-antigen ligase family protein n=1 Tax=Globicatella sanguinis TaxID=13076 RepID=UPI0025433139|nr:O-antigen ligase family protein [Globicatella sanguinis]MDK7631230.1 O-antigen ligase family protein [Globicatella sanguinis]WIK66134.1 O-antigen ligase family protein [Globicatella sanguinis]WKT55539.1 O-antigen ligase family protein [Globicatella sanguinis]
MNLGKKIYNTPFIVFLLLTFLFLYALNNAFIIILIPIVFLPILLLDIKNRRFSKKFIVIFLNILFFSVVFAFFTRLYLPDIGSNIVLQVLITPPIFTYCGYIFPKNSINEKKFIFYGIVIIASGLTLFCFLSYLKTLRNFGTISAAYRSFGSRRMLQSIWSNQPIAATGINVYLSLSLALFPVCLMKFDRSFSFFEERLIKILVTILSLLSIFLVLEIGSRTGVLLFFSVLFIFFLTKLNSIKSLLSFLISISIVLLFLVIVYFNNEEIVNNIWLNSSFYNRLINEGINNDARINAWKISLDNFFIHPFGGREFEIPLKYVHNLWLDVHYDVGIIALTPLIIFCIYSLKDLLNRIITLPKDVLTQLFIGVFIGLYSVFMLEPILQGWIIIFNIYCFFVGNLRCIIEVDEKK